MEWFDLVRAITAVADLALKAWQFRRHRRRTPPGH
jgi:hypothetical protein